MRGMKSPPPSIQSAWEEEGNLVEDLKSSQDKNHDIADEYVVRMRDELCNSLGQFLHVDRIFGQTCFAWFEGIYVNDF